jgi:uncharacterized protein YbaP (TraB family)
MKKNLVCCAVLLFGLACWAQTKTNNSLLWRVTNNKNSNVSYLFGTIHLPQKKFIVYSDSVYEAIRRVNKFYNEVDILNQSFFGDDDLMDFFEEKGRYMDSIKHTANWKNLITRINRQYNTDLDATDLESFAGFSQKLLSSYYQPEIGMEIPDQMLAQFAKTLGKKTGGLETYLLQFKMLYAIIDARLADTTLELKDEGEMLVKMKTHYLTENIDSITSIVENMNPAYRKIVFDNRNEVMCDSIANHIVDESSFFAIGAGHLGGKMGVIEILRSKGFRVTPVFSDNKISLLVINRLINEFRFKDDVPPEVKSLEDTKIILEDMPPPPPPKENPPGVKTEPAPKKKTKGTKG